MSQPASAANRMPAEWEPHEATWLAWPHRREDWPGKFAAIRWVYAEIVRLLAPSETVRILVNGGASELAASKVLTRANADLRRFDFWRIPTDRSWVRDSGPLFLLSADGRERRAVNFAFNGWAKYEDHELDDELTGTITPRLGIHSWRPEVDGRPVVLEGGALDVNGLGCILTTEECLLSKVQERNPGLERHHYEQLFAEHLGAPKTLWLGRGIVGDDTHGHVDDIARFVGPRTIVAAVEDDPTDDNYRPLQENLDRLCGMSDQDGRPFEVVPLPMPAPLIFREQRLPASYANFYIANDRVLVPTFNDPNDRRVLGLLAELFPGRKVIGIHAVDLVWGLGTLHCLTQQEPRLPTASQGGS